jgi:hypothetical protein
VHDRRAVDVSSGSFEKETWMIAPHTGADNDDPARAPRNADLETDSVFASAYRWDPTDIPHIRNNWLCYDFKKRRIVPTHYAIRTWSQGPGSSHMKSWLVETSADRESWREITREEDNKQLNGAYFTAKFAVAGGGECRFIRP